MRRALRTWWALVGRDLRIEWRSKEILYTGGLFAVVLVTLFLFSGFQDRAVQAQAAPGVLWVSIALTGTLVFGRTFERDREADALSGLLMIPGIAGPLFAAKLTTNVLLLLVIEALLVPAVFLTFSLQHVGSWPGLMAVLALGTLGFATLGTVLAAALAALRMREVLLPLVLYPLVIPLLLSGVRATHALLHPHADGDWTDWVGVMIAFNALFLVLARWLFEEAVDHGETG